jgi:hypothetical protein
MGFKEAFEIADNPNFISGIHNYCDRWCERCPFTARCAVYAAEEADPDLDPSAHDINSEAFWKKIKSNFQEARRMLEALAEERGIDLSEVSQQSLEVYETRRRDARNHPLARAAEQYAHAVRDWSKQSKPIEVSDTVEETGSTQEDAADHLEVVYWYQFFIAAKLMRALMSRKAEIDDGDGDDGARDSDGSAKVAMIAIERSISAWKFFSDSRPDQRSEICEMMLRLEKLRAGAEAEFPLAREFVRPGFDEVTPDTLH